MFADQPRNAFEPERITISNQEMVNFDSKKSKNMTMDFSIPTGDTEWQRTDNRNRHLIVIQQYNTICAYLDSK